MSFTYSLVETVKNEIAGIKCFVAVDLVLPIQAGQFKLKRSPRGLARGHFTKHNERVVDVDVSPYYCRRYVVNCVT